MDYKQEKLENCTDQLERMEACLRVGNDPGCEPLTLEQLRAMKKPTPVWMESKKKTIEGWGGYWCLCARGHIITPGLISMYADKMDGVEFYAYPPVIHIDREAWKPCGVCGKADGAISANYCTEDVQGFTITNHTVKSRFCPKCGRPLTEEAWAELEKRCLALRFQMVSFEKTLH